MLFRRKRSLLSTIIEIVRNNFFKSGKIDDMKKDLEEVTENVAYMTYLSKEMEPEVDEVKRRVQMLEEEINSVKRSYERIFGKNLDKE